MTRRSLLGGLLGTAICSFGQPLAPKLPSIFPDLEGISEMLGRAASLNIDQIIGQVLDSTI